MTNYIEFIHDQSDSSVCTTVTSVASASRVIEFPIVTQGLFIYDGWHTYYRYEDDSKSNLIDKGKIFLDNPKSTVSYQPKVEKKIYKR